MVLLRNIVILVFSLIFLVGGGACLYADHLLNGIHFVPVESGESQASTGALFENAAVSSGTESAKAGLVGGLCHDDAVTNILLLGTDDYQKDDTGRSDSMMLVSLDNRRKKLKITSFMRDLYLAIPGIGSYKLTEAYSRAGGKEKGARKVVSTIETNFGVDIDRFVRVDFSVFPKIIDRLGGVEIELTNEKNANGITEAGLINAYSKEKGHPVHVGKNVLTGLQASYYSRIREIGNDYERTERQRKVFSSIVNKLKTSDLGTLNSILADTVPLVMTNMSKDEVISLASHSLTYLKYPLSGSRVPADGEFRESKKGEIIINGRNSDVLIPDLGKCKDTFLKFVYEDKIPTGTYE